MTRANISPALLFVLSWALVVFLYSLEISHLLIYETSEILSVVATYIVAPFTIVYFLSFALLPLRKAPDSSSGTAALGHGKYFTRRINLLLAGFVGVLVLETAIEGYIPIIAMVQGREVSHLDYGIRGLHGLVLALGGVIATSSFVSMICARDRVWHSAVIAFVFSVFAVYVTRKMIVVSFIQMFFAYLAIKQRIPQKAVLISFIGVAGLIYIFGIIGDIRNGRDLIISLAQIKFDYPEWMPSGLIWVYIYVTTPILNLVHAMHVMPDPSYNLGFMCSLVPGMLKESLGCQVTLGFDHAYQVSSSFNVATGYISLYESLGTFGVAAFSAVHGFICRLVQISLRRAINLRSILIYSVVMQATALMIFTNGFLTINVAFQIPLAYFAFVKFKLADRPDCAARNAQ